MQESEVNRQILVVDDEAAVRTGIAQVLSQQDLAVATAADAAQALAHLARQPFAVVLLDIKLPDMDGMRAAETPPSGLPGHRSHHDHRLPHHCRARWSASSWGPWTTW